VNKKIGDLYIKDVGGITKDYWVIHAYFRLFYYTFNNAAQDECLHRMFGPCIYLCVTVRVKCSPPSRKTQQAKTRQYQAPHTIV